MSSTPMRTAYGLDTKYRKSVESVLTHSCELSKIIMKQENQQKEKAGSVNNSTDCKVGDQERRLLHNNQHVQSQGAAVLHWKRGDATAECDDIIAFVLNGYPPHLRRRFPCRLQHHICTRRCLQRCRCSPPATIKSSL